MTEVLVNAVQYWAHTDPSAMMLVWPDEDSGKEYMTTRFDPAFAKSHEISPLLSKSDKRGDPKSTLTRRLFPGGYLVISSGHSATSVSSHPARRTLADEIDKYPDSTGKDGSPLKQIEARSKNYWNAKRVWTGTPSEAGSSAIARMYEDSTKDQYWVPCWHCGEYQVLDFYANVKYDWLEFDESDPDSNTYDPDSARLECIHCNKVMDEGGKSVMLAAGQWRSRNPDHKKKGFHISRLYNPWEEVTEIAADHRDCKGDMQATKVFYNLTLGEEFYQDKNLAPRYDALMARREPFGSVLPAGILRITVGVDVQEDTLVYEVVGWGEGKRSWSLDYGRIQGDTSMPTAECWKELKEVLGTTHTRADDAVLRIRLVFVDSGYRTDTVYEFCAANQDLNVQPVKGLTGEDRPIVSQSDKKVKSKVTKHKPLTLYQIGDHQAKEQLYSQLKISEVGPGYCHFPVEREDRYFKQLTAEVLQKVKRRGREKRNFYLPDGKKNDALDARKYALAALENTGPLVDDRKKQSKRRRPPKGRDELNNWLQGSRNG